MTEFFPNAPLIELAANVQWTTSAPQPVASEGEEYAPDDESQVFFRKFASKIATLGFTQSERLVPPGFDVEADSAVFRFTRVDDPDGSVIYQLGKETFSVNAIPPYKTWNEFRPAVEDGLRALLDTLDWVSTDTTFSRVSLNYIDAFGEEFNGEGSRYQFLTEKLGFGITLPGAISTRLENGTPSTVFTHLTGKTTAGDRLTVRAGHATVSNMPVIVLDTRVIRKTPISTDMEAVMSVLDEEHTLIHEIFVQLTKPIAEILRGNSDERLQDL